MSLKGLKQNSTSISEYFETLKAVLLGELRNNLETRGIISEAYSLLLKDEMDELELKRASECCIEMKNNINANPSYKQHFEIIKTNLTEEATNSLVNSEWAHDLFLLLQSNITQDIIENQPPAVERYNVIQKRTDLEIGRTIYETNTVGKKIYEPTIKVEEAITIEPIMGKHRERRREVAVKTTICFDPLDKGNFEGKYLELLNQRKCKNIVKMYGMFETQIENGYSFTLVMEKSTMSLNDDIIIWSEKPPEERKAGLREREMQAFEVLDQISLAMSELSKHNIWHRDIKPANILIFLKTVTRDGIEKTVKKIKLTDFNISHSYLRSDDGNTQAIAAEDAKGSNIFAAPEIYRCESYKKQYGLNEELKINYNLSDIYSLGLTVLSMFTSENNKYWNCDIRTLQQRMDNLIEKYIESRRLQRILLKMIRIIPIERYTIKTLREFLTQDEI